MSPNDFYHEVEEKISIYLSVGISLIWIINPPTRSVRVIRGDGTTAEFRDAGELSGEQVVTGFQCLVADLFLPKPAEPAATERE